MDFTKRQFRKADTITMHDKKNKFIIVSDNIADEPDEGAIKFATNLAKILHDKKRATLINVNRNSSFSDAFYKITINESTFFAKIFGEIINSFKFVLSLSKFPEKNILWMPGAIRQYHWWIAALLIQLLGKKSTFLIIYQHKPFQPILRLLHKFYHPDVIIISKDLERYYQEYYRGKVLRIQSGVDSSRYYPANPAQKEQLRKKYLLPQNSPILLHVGHAIKKRRLDWMLHIPKGYYGVLVLSSFWHCEKEVMEMLEGRENVIILSEYYPNIEEIYRCCDVYVFTPEMDAAINVPLSVFEAMSCNLPVVTTRHGELCDIDEDRYLRYVSGEDPCETVQEALKLVESTNCNNREKILPYGWEQATDTLYEWLT